MKKSELKNLVTNWRDNLNESNNTQIEISGLGDSRSKVSLGNVFGFVPRQELKAVWKDNYTGPEPVPIAGLHSKGAPKANLKQRLYFSLINHVLNNEKSFAGVSSAQLGTESEALISSILGSSKIKTINTNSIFASDNFEFADIYDYNSDAFYSVKMTKQLSGCGVTMNKMLKFIDRVKYKSDNTLMGLIYIEDNKDDKITTIKGFRFKIQEFLSKNDVIIDPKKNKKINIKTNNNFFKEGKLKDIKDIALGSGTYRDLLGELESFEEFGIAIEFGTPEQILNSFKTNYANDSDSLELLSKYNDDGEEFIADIAKNLAMIKDSNTSGNAFHEKFKFLKTYSFAQKTRSDKMPELVGKAYNSVGDSLKDYYLLWADLQKIFMKSFEKIALTDKAQFNNKVGDDFKEKLRQAINNIDSVDDIPGDRSTMGHLSNESINEAKKTKKLKDLYKL